MDSVHDSGCDTKLYLPPAELRLVSPAPTVKISATTSYVNTKLNSGNSYCYQVTAVSSGGESPKSNEVCANAK